MVDRNRPPVTETQRVALAKATEQLSEFERWQRSVRRVFGKPRQFDSQTGDRSEGPAICPGGKPA